MRRLLVIVIAIMGLTSGMIVNQTVVAQEATPAAEIIDPAECQVEPRAVEDIEALIAGAAEAAAASPSAEDVANMEGQEADQATADAVNATYRELVACLNAGDFLRVYALYTDDYIRRNLGEGGLSAEDLQATPAADQQGGTALVGISDVRRLEGDRVAARVSTIDPAAEGQFIIDAILMPVGDRYLIDDETVVDAPVEGATPTAGTEEQAAASGETGAVEIVSFDIYFEPKDVSIPADTDVTVSLPNDGVTLHNFSIDEFDISVDIAPGATEEVVINAPAGSYEFYCNVPGHKPAGMVGTLTVG